MPAAHTQQKLTQVNPPPRDSKSLSPLLNRHNTQVRDIFELGKIYFELDSYLHNFRASLIFPYFSLHTKPFPYTTYAESTCTKGSQKHIEKTNCELGKPVQQYFAICVNLSNPWRDFHSSVKRSNSNSPKKMFHFA